MQLRQLNLKDKPIFEQFLGFKKHELSAYAFENIYIWKGLFQISWTEIKNNLCLFFQDKVGSFLYLPPLGKKIKAEVVEVAFLIMDRFNRHQEVSRIENVEEQDLPFYRHLGYAAVSEGDDYLCRRSDLVELKGNKFKSKRAVFNYFTKNYKFRYRAYSGHDQDACLELYREWMNQRRDTYKDKVYQGMLTDNFSALKVLLNHYQDLNCMGRIVKINNQIKAFTFGFRLNQDTFCILYEITDLSLKGISQFVFREFLRELKDYEDINIMDDSGLENLKKVKLSYRPIRLIPGFIIKRKSG